MITNSFKQELIKILIDKLLISIILLFVGLYIHYQVEDYKSKQSLIFKLNETRIQKIADVWEQLYLYEKANNDLYYDIQQTVSNKFSAEKIEQNQRAVLIKIELINENFINVLNRNRFWIGEAQYIDLAKYATLLKERSEMRNEVYSALALAVVVGGIVTVLTNPFVGVLATAVSSGIITQTKKDKLISLDTEVEKRKAYVLLVRDKIFSEN